MALRPHRGKDEAPRPRAQLQQGDLNWRPLSWAAVVSSTEPYSSSASWNNTLYLCKRIPILICWTWLCLIHSTSHHSPIWYHICHCLHYHDLYFELQHIHESVRCMWMFDTKVYIPVPLENICTNHKSLLTNLKYVQIIVHGWLFNTFNDMYMKSFIAKRVKRHFWHF